MAEQPNDDLIGGQPMVVMSDEAERTQGRDAQAMNINAGQAVAEAVRTTLGPHGMDKMLVSGSNSIIVTNDGVTILEEMDIDHPAADMVVEVAKSQEEETGDGTTTAVIIAGELLDEAISLLERDVHPQTIASGYRTASEVARERLDALAVEVDADDDELLRSIARTAMTGKLPAGGQEQLVDDVVNAVTAVARDGAVDLDLLATKTITGGAIEDSQLVDGVVIDKDPVHENMPDHVEDARIAVVDGGIEVEETETDLEATVQRPDQLEQFLEQEENRTKALVDNIIEADANVVVCSKGIDDLAQHHLAKHGVLAVRRALDDDVSHVAQATGATVVSDVEDITADDVGEAGLVERRSIGDEERVFVEDCEDPRSVTLLIRGGTEQVVEGARRAVDDALDAVALVVEDSRILPGGGATETALSVELRQHAEGVEGREQLAVEAFADAIETVPRTIAQNSGHDPIDLLVALRSHHAEEPSTVGIATETGDVADMLEAGVVEPLAVKANALASAQEAANLIVRIDDVISGGGSDDDEEAPPAGGPGGPPGAPPGGGMPGGGMPGGGGL